MGALIISRHILIESPPAETDEQFSTAIEDMVLQSYPRRPDWLRFTVGDRFDRRGRQFREFVCMAGSVQLCLMQRARREGGFQRAIIYRGDDDGIPRAYEIRAGRQTEFAPDELHGA
jgi:hypothetical protein